MEERREGEKKGQGNRGKLEDTRNREEKRKRLKE
jgi:hypothetical protein